ncbi:PE domain-containing protein [Mycolicibacter acidiphilus]|nr:PE domain-containing protein [Mycolicibacter acidiphilus]
MSFEPVVDGIGSQVVGNAADGLAAATTATPAVTGLFPAGADLVSIQAAAAFGIDAVETLEQHALAQEKLGQTGAAFVQIAGIYTTVDNTNAGVLA